MLQQSIACLDLLEIDIKIIPFTTREIDEDIDSALHLELLLQEAKKTNVQAYMTASYNHVTPTWATYPV
jgi:hypothetical protein